MNKKLPTWVAVPAVCICSALLAGGVNGSMRDQIDQQAAKSETAALAGVVEAADRFEPRELQESRYAVDNVYAVLNEAGETTGYVGQATVSGYGGPILITAGLDNEGHITGVNVGGDAFNETPGLGGLTREPRFARQFVGKTAGVTMNEGEETDGIDGISGATISSRAVLGGVNNVASYISSAELGILEEEAEAYMGPTVSATEQGFAGDVTVTAGLDDDGAIVYLDIQTPDETEGLGKRASEPEFIKQFIGKKGPFAYGEDGIEAISGASFTSTAVINALNTIASGGGTASEGPISTTVQGFGGDVTVNVMLNGDNSIAALTIDTPDETEGLGKRASEAEFTDQFIGKYAPFVYGENGIEAISGASVTSGAVIDALNEIVPAGDAMAASAPVAEAAPVEAETPAVEEETPAVEAVETEADVVEAAPALSPEENVGRMMRARPAAAALENAQTESAGSASVVVGSLENMMRPRPAESALENARVEGATSDAAVAGSLDSMMRERPVDSALEAGAEAAAEATEAVTDDASRMMRQRPAETAFEANIEETTEEVAEAIEEAVEDVVEEAAEEAAEAVEEVVEEAAEAIDDAERMMRARPVEAEAVEATEAAPNVDPEIYAKYMRPRPANVPGA